MKYIIVDPEDQSRTNLKYILDSYEMLAFQSSFTTYEAAVKSIRDKATDIAFIKMGEAELNAFRLTNELREQSPLLKVVFISSHKEDAVEAFDYGADGFGHIPFDENKIKNTLLRVFKISVVV
ncbi:MAG: response regulator [Sporomusaceae bacterium]|nr:response regulator [Sporomusaceae bacterium]